MKDLVWQRTPMVGEHKLYPIITPLEGCFERYPSVTEFKNYLTTEHMLWKRSGDGWVFWTPDRDDNGEYAFGNAISGNVNGRGIRERIRRVLISVISCCDSLDLVQFWSPKEVFGRSILTTSHQPFAVRCLSRGLNLHRKKCLHHQYIVYDGAEEEQLGPVGRAFRIGRPESSPDLRFYSAKEFPLGHHAASCGLTLYLALPIFDLHHNQCIGVLELVGQRHVPRFPVIRLSTAICEALKVVEMRTTHTVDSEKVTNTWKQEYSTDHGLIMYHQQQPSEIREMLELALKVVPQLHHAQVMVPCNQCANWSNSSMNCMELVASVIKYQQYYGHSLPDYSLHEFLDACAFHNLQNGRGIGKFALSSAHMSCFCQNISDLGICEYPMAHYSQKARLSFCFAICFRNMMHSGNNNGLYVFELFIQPQSRDHAYISFILRLLLRVMENTLKGFKIATGRQLTEKFAVDEVHRKYTNTLKEGQDSMFPLGFKVIPRVLENVHKQPNLHCSMPVEGYDERYSTSEFREYLWKPDLGCLQTQKSNNGFVSWHMKDELLEDGCNDNSVLQLHPSPEKIKHLMSKLTTQNTLNNYLIQFWAHKIIENRSFLSTSDQPFALGYLAKGLCWYRKQCMEHLYYVGIEAEEEELGPPGRVFLTGHPESSPDLRLYSTWEFPLWMHAVQCDARQYLALPLFDLQQKQCFGILEFVGFSYFEYIIEKLREVGLRSTYVDFNSSIVNIHDSRQLALAEIKELFKLLKESPYLEQAFTWTPSSKCANMNTKVCCMERVCDMTTDPFCGWEFIKVNIRKGVAAKVLELENKMCFFENIGDFSMLEQPWAHHAQSTRLEFCFGIALLSAHTGNYLYVLEFFICPGSNIDGYPRSYLSFLLSIMERCLKSFKVASGQQLGEHLIFQTIGSGKEDQLQFKTVQRSHEEDHRKNIEQEHNIIGANSHEENKRDEKNMSFHISYKDLEPHFGKRLEDAANELGVSRSTLKRACKKCGIQRWPSNAKNKKNPSLFQTKTSKTSPVPISIPSSGNLRISDIVMESNEPDTCIESTQEVDKTCQEANVVTIKAKFKEDIIKFDLCLSLGLKKLEEEVAKRLNLMIGNIKLRYVDEDDDLILLTCDEDLHHYVKSSSSIGKASVLILVNLVSNWPAV